MQKDVRFRKNSGDFLISYLVDGILLHSSRRTDRRTDGFIGEAQSPCAGCAADSHSRLQHRGRLFASEVRLHLGRSEEIWRVRDPKRARRKPMIDLANEFLLNLSQAAAVVPTGRQRKKFT